MKQIAIVVALALMTLHAVDANCGCLKVSQCNPNFRVITPEYSPCKVIYRSPPQSCGGVLPYSMEKAIVIPPLPPIVKELDYSISVPCYNRQVYYPGEYEYQMEKAIPEIPIPSLPLKGLKTATERVVVDAPACPCQGYGAYPTQYVNPNLSGCKAPIWYYDGAGNAAYKNLNACGCPSKPAPSPCVAKCTGPIIESLSPSLCGRYENHRKKRDLLGVLLRAPLAFAKHRAALHRHRAALRTRRLRPNHTKKMKKPSSRKSNEFTRRKRAVLLDDVALPFFQIDDAYLDGVGRKRRHRNELVASRRRDESDEDPLVGAPRALRAHPFVILLRTPLKLLRHFHDIGKNFRPIVETFPKMLHTTRKYFRNFGKNLQTNVLDFASNVAGDFDAPAQRFGSFLFPSRSKRSVSENPVKRAKRYILKVVDEDEVQQFLQEKLGGYFDQSNEDAEEISDEKVASDKKFVVKKLSPKVILDNQGKPFIEINGNKRPLFYPKPKGLLGKRKRVETTEKPEEKIEETSDKKGKIDELIEKAKIKLNEKVSSGNYEMPAQSLKEKIAEISQNIQNLVSLNFNDYEDLYATLLNLDAEKKSLCDYWKSVLINKKNADIHCKIKILDFFRTMQATKDAATDLIASHLKTCNNFVLKKLIRLLIRLQKLQCVIHKVVEHFDQRIEFETRSDTEKEIEYVDYLTRMRFVDGKSREELRKSLEREKDDALKKEIRMLENLRNVLKKEDAYVINEVAKCLWEMKNIEKLQQGAIAEMNGKLADNLKIRKELKILFDLLKQLESNENTCENLLKKYDAFATVKKSPILGVNRRKKPLKIKKNAFAEYLDKISKI